MRAAHPNPTHTPPTEGGPSSSAPAPAFVLALLAAVGALYWVYCAARRARAPLSRRGGVTGPEGRWLRGTAWWLGDARWSRVAAVDDVDDVDGEDASGDAHGCVGAAPSLTRLEGDGIGACPGVEDDIEVL